MLVKLTPGLGIVSEDEKATSLEIIYMKKVTFFDIYIDKTD
jgi:hypothetical protein